MVYKLQLQKQCINTEINNARPIFRNIMWNKTYILSGNVLSHRLYPQVQQTFRWNCKEIITFVSERRNVLKVSSANFPMKNCKEIITFSYFCKQTFRWDCKEIITFVSERRNVSIFSKLSDEIAKKWSLSATFVSERRDVSIFLKSYSVSDRCRVSAAWMRVALLCPCAS